MEKQITKKLGFASYGDKIVSDWIDNGYMKHNQCWIISYKKILSRLDWHLYLKSPKTYKDCLSLVREFEAREDQCVIIYKAAETEEDKYTYFVRYETEKCLGCHLCSYDPLEKLLSTL